MGQKGWKIFSETFICFLPIAITLSWFLAFRLKSLVLSSSSCHNRPLTGSVVSGPVCSSPAPVSTQSSWSSSAWLFSPARSSLTTVPSTTTRVFSPSCTCYPYFSFSTSSVTSSTNQPAVVLTQSQLLTSRWAQTAAGLAVECPVNYLVFPKDKTSWIIYFHDLM